MSNFFQKNIKVPYISFGLLVLVITSYLLTNQILICHDLCAINWDSIKFFPYTDFAENLTGAMNAANGYKFGVDYQQPHSPGIYLLLGIFYKLIGLASIEPSIGSAYLRLVFGAAFLLAMVSYFFLKEFGVKYGLLILCALLIIFYPLKLYLPMSETFAFWLAIPLLHSNLMLLNGRKISITFEDLALPILITFLGIGFPSVLIFPYLVYLIHIIGKRASIEKADFFKYFTFLMALISIVLVMTNPASLWFWTIEVNQVDVKQHLLENIWVNITSVNKLGGFYDLTTYIPLLLSVAVVMFWERRINFKSLVYILAIYFPIFWRVPGGYKASVAVSLLISLIIFVSPRHFYKERYIKYAMTMLLLLSIFSTTSKNLLFGVNPNRFSKIQEVGQLNFNICKFSENFPSDCRCVNSLVFGPQVFLQNDIKQCKYQMNTWVSRLGTSPKYMKFAYDSLADHYASYLVPPMQFYQDDKQLIKFIKQIEEKYQCKTYNNDWKFCSY